MSEKEKQQTQVDQVDDDCPEQLESSLPSADSGTLTEQHGDGVKQPGVASEDPAQGDNQAVLSQPPQADTCAKQTQDTEQAAMPDGEAYLEPSLEPSLDECKVLPASEDKATTTTQTKTTPPNHKPTIHKTVRLPNARQNRSYDVVLDEVVRQEWLNLELLDDAGTTLHLSDDSRSISGTPLNNGECQLRLQAQSADGSPVALTLELLINPDPKTLWHTVEPQSPLFRKPHQAYKQCTDARVSLTAARVRGRSHAHKGSFCEDDFAVLCDGDGVGYLGMVADGAGSSRFSRLASQVLCDSVPRHLEREARTLQSNGELAKLHAALSGTDNQRQAGLDAAGTVLANAVKRGLSDIMAHTKLALHDERSKQYQALTMRDLYTTCLVFWALPLHGGDWLLVSYWVGDGGLAVQHGAGFTLLGTPDGGEFSGQTRFLSGEEISDAALKKRLRAAIYPDLRSVWALTDGVTDAKFASEQQLERSGQWQSLTDDIIPALSSAEALYDWLGFWSQGNHDDRSVCVLQVREVSA